LIHDGPPYGHTYVVMLGDWMTVHEAATVLGVTDGRVRQLLSAGALRGERLGARMWLLERASVERYKKERRPVGRPRKADG
jgi:excisionase family DNA binding protein